MSGVDAVKLGIIGAGRIAQVAHLPAVEKASGITLAGISDPSPALAQGVSSRYGVPGYTNTEELLAQDIDAVVIAVPDRFHLKLGLQALEAGKHVLVEKPLASSTAEAADLAKAAKDRGLKLQVGAMKRHDPGIAYAKESISELGPVVSVTAWYRVMSALRADIEATLYPPVVVDDAVRTSEATFKANRERYLLATHGAHIFDGLRYLAGDMISVQAHMANVGGDYSWHGMGTLANGGGLASFEITANVHSEWAEGFDIFGERGHISVRTYFPFFRRPSDVRVFLEGSSEATVPVFADSDPFERQLEAFAHSIVADLPTNPGPEDGVAAVRMIEAVADSVNNDGKQVSL